MAQGGAPPMSALRHTWLVGPRSRRKAPPSAGLHPLAPGHARSLRNPAPGWLPAGQGGDTVLFQAGKCPRVPERSACPGAAHPGWAVAVRVNGTVQADGVQRVRVQPAPELRIADGPDNADCDTRPPGLPSARPGVIAGNSGRGTGDAAVQPAGSRRPAGMIQHAALSGGRQLPCDVNGGLSP